MTGGAPGSYDEPDDLQFRSLSAPGLEEDDVFAALHGLPVPSPFWGDGWPAAARDPDRPWDEAAERRRRHRDLLAKWREEREGGAGPAARPDGPPAPPP